MSDIAAFFRARLDEDQAKTDAAGPSVHQREWDVCGPPGGRRVEDGHGDVVLNAWGRDSDAAIDHAAYYDPLRTRDEIRAKRRILAWYENAAEGSIVRDALGAALTALVAVYASHPDYDEAWR